MTAKQRILEILDEQPDDSTYEELLRELVFAQTIERGLADSEAGRTSLARRCRRGSPRGQSRLDARGEPLAPAELYLDE